MLCYTRELAYQICHEFDRFRKYLPSIKTAVFYGGIPVQTNKDLLRDEQPHIIIGTPGRILQLADEKALVLKNVKHFVLDECDKMLDSLGILPPQALPFDRLPSLSMTFGRYAQRRSTYFQTHTSRQTSYDVFCYIIRRDPWGLQKIHAQCNSFSYSLSYFCCSVNRGDYAQTLRSPLPL